MHGPRFPPSLTPSDLSEGLSTTHSLPHCGVMLPQRVSVAAELLWPLFSVAVSVRAGLGWGRRTSGLNRRLASSMARQRDDEVEHRGYLFVA